MRRKLRPSNREFPDKCLLFLEPTGQVATKCLVRLRLGERQISDYSQLVRRNLNIVSRIKDFRIEREELLFFSPIEFD